MLETIKKSFKFLGLLFLIVVINAFPLLLIAKQEETPQHLQWVLGLSYLVIASVIILCVWRRYKNQVSETVTKWRFSWRDAGFILLFYVLARILIFVGLLILQQVTGSSTTANDASLMATDSELLATFPLYIIASHLAIGIFAPVLEEIVFRGIFDRYFFKQGSKWLKLLVSSSIFALMHGIHPLEFAIYFFLGSAFYLAYERRKNIHDAIALHFLNNGVVIAISLIHYIKLIFG